MSNTETNKVELKNKFKEFVENETMIDYRIAIDFLPFISEQIKLAREQAIDECIDELNNKWPLISEAVSYYKEQEFNSAKMYLLNLKKK